MIPRSLVLILLVAPALACFGCGNSNAIKVTGKLLQAGQPYVPPAGQRVVVTLYVVDVKDASEKRIPAQEPFHGYYDPKDGTFVVPGPDGHGIPPGQYRILIFQGLTREGESKAPPHHKGTSRKAPGNNRETDFFQRPDTGLELGSGDAAPSYKSCRSQLYPATFLAMSRVIDFFEGLFGPTTSTHRARSHSGCGTDCRSRQGAPAAKQAAKQAPKRRNGKGSGSNRAIDLRSVCGYAGLMAFHRCGAVIGGDSQIERIPWRPPVGAPVPRSSGLANRFR